MIILKLADMQIKFSVRLMEDSMKDRIIPEFLRKYWINYLWGAIFLF